MAAEKSPRKASVIRELYFGMPFVALLLAFLVFFVVYELPMDSPLLKYALFAGVIGLWGGWRGDVFAKKAAPLGIFQNCLLFFPFCSFQSVSCYRFWKRVDTPSICPVPICVVCISIFARCGWLWRGGYCASLFDSACELLFVYHCIFLEVFFCIEKTQSTHSRIYNHLSFCTLYPVSSSC